MRKVSIFNAVAALLITAWAVGATQWLEHDTSGAKIPELAPYTFYVYSTTKAVKRHTVSSTAQQLGVTCSAASFFNYTGAVDSGAVVRYPLAASTHYRFAAPKQRGTTRLAFQVTSSASTAKTKIYVIEQ